MRQDLTRRDLLAAAAVTAPLLASGCANFGGLGTPPRQSADVSVAREAIAAETAMIARYHAVLAAFPALTRELSPLLAQHQEHLARLRSRLVDPRAGGVSSPSPSGAPTSAPAGTPGSAAAARTYLGRAERAAGAALLSRLPAASPSFAQLLASIGASEATHAMVLAGRRAGL